MSVVLLASKHAMDYPHTTLNDVEYTVMTPQISFSDSYR